MHAFAVGLLVLGVVLPGQATTFTVTGKPVLTDQRGVTRPQAPAYDIGAFELVQNENTAPHSRSISRAAAASTRKQVVTLYNNGSTSEL